MPTTPTVKPFHALKTDEKLRRLSREIRDWSPNDLHNAQHGTADTLDELADEVRDLRFGAMVVLGYYLDRQYDGPPGPQDDRGGNGMPDVINELTEVLARAEHGKTTPPALSAVRDRALRIYRGEA